MSGEQARAKLVFGGLLLCLVVLMLRAGWIQLVRGKELADRARRQHFRQLELPGPRGSILDRRGRILAASYHSCSIAVDPQEVEDIPAFATRLAFLLADVRAAPALAGRVAERKQAGARFAYLSRWVDREVARRVEAACLPGVDVREEPRREYPHGTAAAALIGLVGDEQGLCGLERQFDSRLRGRDGCSAVFRAGRGKHLYLYPELDREPRRGCNLHTTLDIALQQIAEDALAELHARFEPTLSCALVLDPHSGDILALAGRPAFDPAAERGPDVLERLRIPAAQNAYPVGSVMKPLIMAWALTRGAVHPGQMFDCGPGHKFFGGRLLHDVKPNGFIDLETVLVKSSNIGMAQVGMALGVDDAYDFLCRVGFGRPTGVEIAGEQPGRVTPRPRWTERYTLISVSMGRELMVTPIQLACAYASLLNGGRVPRPTLVKGAPREPAGLVPYHPEAAAFVRDAMERVVNEGTGRRARIPGLRVAGKTGTSKIELKGHTPKYVSSFVGFAPADRPAMLVLVLADNPRSVGGLRPYGGTVAAPAVREIIRRGLPLVTRMRNARNDRTSPESGVRQVETKAKGKVRVAAVHWSSVNAGERISPAQGRNPDSVDVDEPCRSARRR